MPSTDKPVSEIKMDILPIIQILKHAQDNLPGPVSGQLLGIDVDGVLEITHAISFPSEPNANFDEIKYGSDMMGKLAEFSLIDTNNCGWYCSTYIASFCTSSFLASQYRYQKTLGNNICALVLDSFQLAHGQLSLKAVRLTEEFMKLYENGTITLESIKKSEFNSTKIYEELPISIDMNPLSRALLNQAMMDTNYDFNSIHSSIATSSFLEKNLEELINVVDTVAADRLEYASYIRNTIRQQYQQQSWINKRKEENKSRLEKGLELLPEEDLDDPVFKNSTLITNSVDTLTNYNSLRMFCDRINNFADQSIQVVLSNNDTN